MYLCASVLVCWCVVVMVFRCSGVLMCWCASVLLCWYTGVLEFFTCVLGHGGLIGVSLLFKDNVAKLQHGRDDL